MEVKKYKNFIKNDKKILKLGEESKSKKRFYISDMHFGDERLNLYGRDLLFQNSKECDDFIIDSRLAWHFIPDSIKVKLVCNDEVRMKRVSERDEISLEDAKTKTIEREISEKTRYFNYYKIKNYSDDKHFDLIIDTTNISIEEVSKKIDGFMIRKLKE